MKDQLPAIAIIISGCCFVFIIALSFMIFDNRDQIKETLEETIINAGDIEINGNRISKKVYKNNLVSCESCGAVVLAHKAYTGVGEIRRRQKPSKDGWLIIGAKEDYIYYPKYCKLHKPENLKKSDTVTVTDDSITFHIPVKY